MKPGISNGIKKIISGIGLAVLLTFVILPTVQVLAQTQNKYEYTVLAPLPGTTDCADDKLNSNECKTTLQKYLPGVFNLAIGLSAAAAVFMIVLGGIQYMTTDAIQGKSEGKARIKNALISLTFVIASYLILYTINPNLLTLNLNIEDVNIKPAEGGSLGPAATSGDFLCPTGQCVAMPNGIAMVSSGKTINQAIASKLTTLDTELEKAGLQLVVTEAYPPSRHHQDPCHTTGTCVDARKVSDDKIKTFVDTTWNQAGLRAEFEVETPTRKEAILTASCGNNTACKTALAPAILVLEPRNGVRQISGEHFSVYNR